MILRRIVSTTVQNIGPHDYRNFSQCCSFTHPEEIVDPILKIKILNDTHTCFSIYEDPKDIINVAFKCLKNGHSAEAQYMLNKLKEIDLEKKYTDIFICGMKQIEDCTAEECLHAFDSKTSNINYIHENKLVYKYLIQCGLIQAKNMEHQQPCFHGLKKVF